MNERIKLLAEQCYETGPIGKDGWPEYSKFNVEKFTQFIIKECVGWVNDNVGLIDEETKADLLKHFGVK